MKKGLGIELHSLLSEASVSSPRAKFHVERHHDPPRQQVGPLTSTLPCFEPQQDSAPSTYKTLQPRNRPKSAMPSSARQHKSSKNIVTSTQNSNVKNKDKRSEPKSKVRAKSPIVSLNKHEMSSRTKLVNQGITSVKARVLRKSVETTVVKKQDVLDKNIQVQTSMKENSTQMLPQAPPEVRNVRFTDSCVLSDDIQAPQESTMSVAQLSKYLQDIIASSEDATLPEPPTVLSRATSEIDPVLVFPYIQLDQNTVHPSALKHVRDPVIPKTNNVAAREEDEAAKKRNRTQVAQIPKNTQWNDIDTQKEVKDAAKLEFIVTSPLRIPEAKSTVSVSSALRQGTRALHEARAWLQRQTDVTSSKTQIRKTISAPVTRDRATKTKKGSSLQSINIMHPQNGITRRPKSAREQTRVTSIDSKTSQNQEKQPKSSPVSKAVQATRHIASLDHYEKHKLMKTVLFETSKPLQLDANLKSSSTWQRELSSGFLDSTSSSMTSRHPLHKQSVRIPDDHFSDGSAALPQTMASPDLAPRNDRVFVTSTQNTEIKSKLCKQTLQPLTIKRALVCQPGPIVKISPQPLKLRDKNVCLTQVQAEEPITHPESSPCIQVEETAVQTSPTHTSPEEILVKELLEKVALSNTVIEAQVKKLNFDMRSEVKQTETQTSPSAGEERVLAEMSTQTASPELQSRQHMAVQVQLPHSNAVSQSSKEIDTFGDTSVAIQTEQINTCDVATEVSTLLTEAVAEIYSEKLPPMLDVIGPSGDAGYSENVVEVATNIEITEKSIAPDIPIVTKDKNKLSKLLSSRMLSPILEQTSTSDNSPSNASPLAVPVVSLIAPNPVNVEESVPTSPVDVQDFLPLLCLSMRTTKLIESQTVVSEHEASSTLSSLADSELSSLDTTVSPSLTMVESSIIRSEGELVCQGKISDPPDDTSASDDSSSATLSSAPCSQTDWSRESGRSSGLIDRSVGEVGSIPAAQRRRVLYLASRVAPSLLTYSTSSRSDGELSEGQVLPRSSRKNTNVS